MNTAVQTEQTAVAAAVHDMARVPGRTITVQGVDIVVADFLVGRFMTRFNDDGTATISADAVPTTYISYDDALPKLEAAGLKMLTLAQSHVLALEVLEQGANWSGGEVGKGKLMQGLHMGTVRGAVDGNYVSPNEEERRGFVLSNGEIVNDVAGHLYAWLFDDVHGDERGLVKTDSLPVDSPAVYAPYEAGTHGIGYPMDEGDDLSGGALIRGGCWSSGGYAGVFGVDGGWPGGDVGDVGVRSTKDL